MTTKKPDRWERTVLKALKRQDQPGDPAIWLNGPDIVKLLRNEHRAVVKMVQKQCEAYQHEERERMLAGTDPYEWNRKLEACSDILAKLTERAK